jgi:hypothetical protein
VTKGLQRHNNPSESRDDLSKNKAKTKPEREQKAKEQRAIRNRTENKTKRKKKETDVVRLALRTHNSSQCCCGDISVEFAFLV